jgi:prepilin-type N-terminal cleavage/methylation domain-containing protein
MNKKKRGFTFIEMLVVLAVIAVALPSLFLIVYAILQQQVKIYRLTEVKRQGDYLINNMVSLIRNSGTGLYRYNGVTGIPVCDSTANSPYPSSGNGTTNLYFKDRTGTWFAFAYSGTQVASQSGSAIGTLSGVNLTTSKVKVSNLSFACTKASTFSAPLVTVGFTIKYNSTSATREEENATLDYQTFVKLQTYQ